MVYIIGEMAWGHNGNFNNAIKILNGVKQANANAISIHITDLNNYMTKNYRCLAGQTLSSSADNSISIFNYLEKINLTNEEWMKFNAEAKELNVEIVAMCNDLNSFYFSKNMDIAKYVVSAASLDEFSLIEEIVKFNHDIILRIGGATLGEIDQVIDLILDIDNSARINLLAGIQLYPTPINQLQISSIKTLIERYKDRNVSVGLADHIDGDDRLAITLPALALSYGANVIEKHITTARTERLEDYEAALGLKEFKEFVDYIRVAESALGDGSLKYLENDSYEKYRNVARKKIVAAGKLKAGLTISLSELAFKRSDEGAQLKELNNILGKKLLVNKNFEDGINLEDVK